MSIVIQTAHGGVDGIPAIISNGNDVRLHSTDSPLVDASDPIIHPEFERTYTYEKWIRLWAETPPPVAYRNIKFQRQGPNLFDIIERYGERSQTEGYEPPVAHERYALNFIPDDPTLLSEDQHDYTDEGQIGPWIVIQWDIGPRALYGPQATTYRFFVDEY